MDSQRGSPSPPSISSEESFLTRLKQTLTDDQLFYTKAFFLAAGGAVAAFLVYGVYNSYQSKGVSVTPDSKINEFIASEMERLRNCSLIDEEGLLEKQDFFDLILLMKLKTARKTNNEIGVNQRKRIKHLDEGLAPN